MRSLELCWGTLGPTKNTGVFYFTWAIGHILEPSWAYRVSFGNNFWEEKRPKSEPYMAQHSPQNGSRYSQKGLGMAPIRLPWRSLSALWGFCWAKNRSKSEPYTKGSDFWHFSSRKWFPETSCNLIHLTQESWESSQLDTLFVWVDSPKNSEAASVENGALNSSCFLRLTKLIRMLLFSFLGWMLVIFSV